MNDGGHYYNNYVTPRGWVVLTSRVRTNAFPYEKDIQLDAVLRFRWHLNLPVFIQKSISVDVTIETGLSL